MLIPYKIFISSIGVLYVPTVGASGIVFALLGMLLMLNPTLRQLRNYIYVALTVILQLFFGHSNIALHLLAFTFGALAVILRSAAQKIKV